ncbi:hypothetical protein T07_3852 [Trichinella nelsoni]|uniref:Uncharacterized protein n=1 Tax=Trichinella nelsoni TaxID=6336 RepID=A0A0V0RI77_9BILA|nr:hypothetical protein T07_3852 [Trichinella nelsoni]
MSISVSVSNPAINPFDDKEAVWLPCAEESAALARNSPSHGKVYTKLSFQDHFLNVFENVALNQPRALLLKNSFVRMNDS